MAEATRIFRLLNFEQRMAAVGALLLAISTFGPFSFVELAEITIAVAVLALLRARGLGREFHLPFGDGTAIAAAGVWAGLLIVVRLFDRPLGQYLLALVCAAILTLAGRLERAQRPADDLPPAEPQPRPERRRRRPPPAAQPNGEAATEPLPPPEFKPYKPEPGQQLHLGGEEDQPPDEA